MAASGVHLTLLRLLSGPLASLPILAHAHALDAPIHMRGALPDEWSVEPWVLVVTSVSLLLYVVGWVRLRIRAKRGDLAYAHQGSAFLGGWLALVAALCSPLDTWSDVLFSAHMLQHETLMIVAAPLLVIGRPLPFWLWAFPHASRTRVASLFRLLAWRRLWAWLTRPYVAWSLHVFILWGWHMPRYFEAALKNEGIHACQHISFFLSSVLLWWTIIGDSGRGHRGQAMLSLFTTMIHTGALGALLTLAPTVWYPAYIEPCKTLGIDPLQDQQLGGLVMWIPAGLVYVAGALLIAARWLLRPRLGALVGHPPPVDRRDGL